MIPKLLHTHTRTHTHTHGRTLHTHTHTHTHTHHYLSKVGPPPFFWKRTLSGGACFVCVESKERGNIALLFKDELQWR